MKQVLLFLIILGSVFLFANEKDIKYKPEMTLKEASKQANIPVKKLAFYLDLELDEYNTVLRELDVTEAELKQAISSYNENKKFFFSGIVFVGMGIVFFSLMIVGFIINLLRHIGEKKKIEKVTVQTTTGKVSASKFHISSNGVVAAITAIYLHEAEQEENINLTWKRQVISLWQTVGMVESRTSDYQRGNQ